MAKYLQDNVPGIIIPDKLMDMVKVGGSSAGYRAAHELVNDISGMVAGIHIMSVKESYLIRQIIEGIAV